MIVFLFLFLTRSPLTPKFLNMKSYTLRSKSLCGDDRWHYVLTSYKWDWKFENILQSAYTQNIRNIAETVLLHQEKAICYFRNIMNTHIRPIQLNNICNMHIIFSGTIVRLFSYEMLKRLMALSITGVGLLENLCVRYLVQLRKGI